MNNSVRSAELNRTERLRLAKDDEPQMGAQGKFLEEGKGSNWIHPSLRSSETLNYGIGVFATKALPENTLLIVFGGKILTLEEFEQLPEEMKQFPYQIDSELFIGPIDSDDIGVGERVNHSCSPNAGFQGSIHLVAIRDIDVGEQITLDYATCVAANGETFTMSCQCGSATCRKLITGQDWQLKEVQSRLLPFYQPFIQERVRRRRERARARH